MLKSKTNMIVVIALMMTISAALAISFSEDADAETSFVYDTEDYGMALTSCVTTESEVTIPDYVDGTKVYRIGSGAFRDNQSLVTVYGGNYITTIGDNAFKGCTSLKYVAPLTNSVFQIGDCAFYSSNGVQLDYTDADSIERSVFMGRYNNLVYMYEPQL